MKRYEVTGAMMLIITGVAWLSWYVIDITRRHTFEQALNYFTAVAIKMEFANESAPKSPTAIVIENGVLDDEFWRRLERFETVRSLSIKFTKITDADAKRLAKQWRLEELYLPGCEITDDGIDELAKLQSLKIIDVSQTSIGDAAALKLITTADPKDIDAKLLSFRSLRLRRNLIRIDLTGTNVRPEIVEYLAAQHPHVQLDH